MRLDPADAHGRGGVHEEGVFGAEHEVARPHHALTAADAATLHRRDRGLHEALDEPDLVPRVEDDRVGRRRLRVPEVRAHTEVLAFRLHHDDTGIVGLRALPRALELGVERAVVHVDRLASERDRRDVTVALVPNHDLVVCHARERTRRTRRAATRARERSESLARSEGSESGYPRFAERRIVRFGGTCRRRRGRGRR